jgi:glutathione S-transferase
MLQFQVNRWLLWEASSWFPTCYIYLVQNVAIPLMKGEPDQKIIDAEADKFHRSAGILEARLSKNKWLTGDQITIADIAVAAPM